MDYIKNRIDELYGKCALYDTYNHCIIRRAGDYMVDSADNKVALLYNGTKTRSIRSTDPGNYAAFYCIPLLGGLYTHCILLLPNYNFIRFVYMNNSINDEIVLNLYHAGAGHEFEKCELTHAIEMLKYDSHFKLILLALRGKLPKYILYNIFIYYIGLQTCDFNCTIIQYDCTNIH